MKYLCVQLFWNIRDTHSGIFVTRTFPFHSGKKYDIINSGKGVAFHMKKTVSLLLVFLLVVLSACAFADTLSVRPGTPAGISKDFYKAVFDITCSTVGVSYTWEEQPAAEDGYEVYTAHADEIRMDLKVYTSGGKVSHVAIVAENYYIPGPDEAFILGEWLSQTLGSAVFSFYYAEGGKNTDNMGILLDACIDQYSLFLGTSLTDHSALPGGIATTMDVLEYPTGLEINGTGTEKEATLNIRFVVTTKDGQVEVSK